MLYLPKTSQVRFIVLTAILLLSPLCCQADSQGAQVFKTLDDAVFAIGNSCGIPTGLELMHSVHVSRPITLQISCSALPSTFRRLLSQRPDYTWTLQEGVYDIYPKANSDGVLNIRVSAFLVRKADLRQTSDVVERLPEFESWLSKHRAQNSDLYVVVGHMWPSNRIVSLSLRNVSLLTILNRVIRV